MQKLVTVPIKLIMDPTTRVHTGEALVDGLVTRVCSLRCNQDTPLLANADDFTGGLSGVAVMLEERTNCARDANGQPYVSLLGPNDWRPKSRIRLVLLADDQSYEIAGWNHLCSWWHNWAPSEVFYILDFPST